MTPRPGTVWCDDCGEPHAPGDCHQLGDELAILTNAVEDAERIFDDVLEAFRWGLMDSGAERKRLERMVRSWKETYQ